jgi:hypothetical protein
MLPSERCFCINCCEILQIADFCPRKRRLLMLQVAYIDDSGRGQGAAFVLAGFIAKSDDWIAFDHDWQAVLDGSPKLAYYKGQEMHASDRTSDFVGVIEKYHFQPIRVIVPRKAYEEAFYAQIASGMDTEYFVACMSVIEATGKHVENEDEAERLRVVFDWENSTEEQRIRWGFMWGMSLASERERRRFTAPPDFRDDKEVVALQAADLYAWYLRFSVNYQREQGREWHDPIWERFQKLPAPIGRDWGAMDLNNLASLVTREHERLGLEPFPHQRKKANLARKKLSGWPDK